MNPWMWLAYIEAIAVITLLFVWHLERVRRREDHLDLMDANRTIYALRHQVTELELRTRTQYKARA